MSGLAKLLAQHKIFIDRRELNLESIETNERERKRLRADFFRAQAERPALLEAQGLAHLIPMLRNVEPPPPPAADDEEQEEKGEQETNGFAELDMSFACGPSEHGHVMPQVRGGAVVDENCKSATAESDAYFSAGLISD